MKKTNNNNSIPFNNLKKEEKNRIMMYTTARQFKNAVPIEEMLIIPSKTGEWVNYCKIKFNNTDLNDIILKYGIKDNSQIQLGGQIITARGDKIISKQTPFIVNKTFACEVYLKLILLEKNINFEDLKGTNRHKLWKLYSKTDGDFKKALETKIFSKGFRNIDDKIKNISEAFINWRYIYEKYEVIASVDFLFLDELCNYLDKQAKQLIFKNYSYDVNRDAR